MYIDKQRRRLIKHSALGLLSACIPFSAVGKANAGISTKIIPSSGENLPVIGMGTWITFNVGSDRDLLEHRRGLVDAFFKLGGGLIDSSPMYGSAPDVLGYALAKLDEQSKDALFSAEKVWSPAGGNAEQQFDDLTRRWGQNNFDLLQIHNLRDWREHLDALFQMKAEGKIRYIGITTSHGRRHAEFEKIMRSERIDFAQCTYNITDREVEQRILPMAQEQGIAVIANRPYDGGYLIKNLKRNHTLPAWAREELGCRTWADFLLKFIVSHPAVNCAIPATSRLEHLHENMLAGTGDLLDDSVRRKMIAHIESL